MPHRNVIAIGASMGGIEALPKLIGGLPEDLGAAVFVVMHIAAGGGQYLPERINRVSKLAAAPARDGEAIRANRVYCAVEDRHLMTEGDRVRLSHGSRESHARPSIDVLFRSAAYAKGNRVIGVVLTGMLDDGTAGLWTIKDKGGVAIVQSPNEAAYPDMPRSALRHVRVNHVLTLAEMPAVLTSLVAEQPATSMEGGMTDDKLRIENQIVLEGSTTDVDVRELGERSFYTCPECHGSMVEIKDGTFARYRCHTGHGFTARALSDEGRVQIEKTLWAALAQLEEREVLLREMEQSMRGMDAGSAAADRYATDREETHRLVRHLRELLTEPALQARDSA
ncbi:MAG TPA: chemotaxis protein CheB [Gammaproteobacteria bacterium]|nr:chemotaxis protein CheB [Gammaproteobacteria bacterium]